MEQIKTLIHRILSEYSLPWDGVHGVSHWARVLENGRSLAGQTGANLAVVELFAVLHDSKRTNEGIDDGHGQRGADFARLLRGLYFDLADEELELLALACTDHTNGRTEADITVQTCWDADRLDLYRVGIYPQAELLCTAAARQPELFGWAVQRGRSRFVPELVLEEWGIGSGD